LLILTATANEPHFGAINDINKGAFARASTGIKLTSMGAFTEIAGQVPNLWHQSRRADELVPLSGSFQSLKAHHLHNPSFHTLSPHKERQRLSSNRFNNLLRGNLYLIETGRVLASHL
jgi:hypothetical protein